MAAVLTAITEALMDMSGGFYLPSNGDLLAHDVNFSSASADKGFFLKVLKNVLYLNSPHLGGSQRVSSRVETRIEAVTWTPVAAAGFALNADGSVTDAGSGNDILAHIRIPHGCTLNEVHVSINPVDGHAGVPGTKPTFTVTEQDITTSTFTTIATGTDASAAAGAYDAIHYVSATGLSVAISRTTKTYRIRFVGEFGANLINGLVVYGAVKLVYTRTTVGED